MTKLEELKAEAEAAICRAEDYSAAVADEAALSTDAAWVAAWEAYIAYLTELEKQEENSYD